MHMWPHVTNHLIISINKDSNSEVNKNYVSVTVCTGMGACHLKISMGYPCYSLMDGRQMIWWHDRLIVHPRHGPHSLAWADSTVRCRVQLTAQCLFMSEPYIDPWHVILCWHSKSALCILLCQFSIRTLVTTPHPADTASNILLHFFVCHTPTIPLCWAQRHLRRSHLSRLAVLCHEGISFLRQDPNRWESDLHSLSPVSSLWLASKLLLPQPNYLTGYVCFSPHGNTLQDLAGQVTQCWGAQHLLFPISSGPKSLEPSSSKYILCLSMPTVMEAAGPHWCSGAAHGASIVLLTSTLSPDVDWILNGSLRGFLQAHLRGECAFPQLPVVFMGSQCQVNSTPEPAPLPSPLPPTGGILTHFGPCCLPQLPSAWTMPKVHVSFQSICHANHPTHSNPLLSALSQNPSSTPLLWRQSCLQIKLIGTEGKCW
jgi:hypothetical protein